MALQEAPLLYHGSDLATTAIGQEKAISMDTVRIGDVLSGLDNTIHELQEAVDRADARLQPILRPERPITTTADGSKPTQPTESEVGVRIWRASGELQSLARRLHVLVDRVDL